MKKQSSLIPITTAVEFQDKNGNIYKKPRIHKEFTHQNKGKDYKKVA